MIHVHWKHVAIALAVAPIAAIIFAWIGFFNIGASTGHWKVTDWFLHFAMRSAVRTYSLAVEVPEKLPAEGVQPAAGHYARGCAICHGAPGEPRSPATLNMLPKPPDLAGIADKWTDAELFRIVQHGVRFTGMPAWPQPARDDEVWAMVAFLRELPDMDAARYRDLAYGGQDGLTLQPRGLEATLGECARCHGLDGAGRAASVPVLAGQGEAYLRESLRAYVQNLRPSGMMALPMQSVAPETLDALARHFAGQPAQALGAPPPTPTQGAALAGERLAREGRAADGIPACLSCHDRADANPLYPRIVGQNAVYVRDQLRLFRDGERGGGRFAHVMTAAAKKLTDRDIDDLAAYLAAQP